MDSAGNPMDLHKIALGRKLYYDTRLSADQTVSCNSCHDLANYGVDTGAVSLGVRGQLGGRNSPTVYNAAGQIAQFWDGRAHDVEAQAKGPILNPVEMAMPNAAAVMRRIAQDPEYGRLFRAAFIGQRNPITYDNLARAIGAFERGLVTPSRWDRFLQGVDTALTDAERAGFNEFVAAGCAGCHNGPYVGGGQFQKAGLVNPWPDSSDVGRQAVTRSETDRMVFKVPTLRNIERTAPYFHHGDARTLDSAVMRMAHAQLGKALTPEQVASIVTWLKALTGDIPQQYIAAPAPAAN
jgi:cytochrome c peroxidase